jgi:predicted acyl esterase
MNARSFQTMVPMRDGTRLNTFGFLPDNGGPRWPVILHRTPYGIAAADAPHKFDHTRAWLPNLAEPMRGSILRGWKAIVEHGYVAVYQDCRGRHGSEGEDRVYADDANDGYDTLAWIASQSWTNGRVGMSGSSAGATTTFAAASTRHPSIVPFCSGGWFQHMTMSSTRARALRWSGFGCGGRNIPGLSASHREAVMRFGVGAVELDRAAASAAELQPARRRPATDAPYQLAGLPASAADRLPRLFPGAAVS